MDPQQAKQQIVESVKDATNVLVTVSKNPSVDQLSAAIGLTLMLNKLGKHAAAVFSGSIPPAIQFLEPNKTIDNSVDGLRDFVISLSKEKADKLRYKVEDDLVKIYITPYKTQIKKEDFNFSQGDFNVDVVIALGVDTRDHLDEAIKAHGRILHDATLISLSNESESSLGSINWFVPEASSLSEMLVSISEAFQGGILDAPMSTAFLTGIVAATDRFRNNRTSPKVMTMSAQLMAAGANQQLVASNLASAGATTADTPAQAPAEPPKQEEAKVEEGQEVSLDHTNDQPKTDDQPDTPQDQTLEQLQHELEDFEANKDQNNEAAQTQQPAEPPKDPNEPQTLDQIETQINHESSAQLAQKSRMSTSALPPVDTSPNIQTSSIESSDSTVRGRSPASSYNEPLLGGTFNATVTGAEEEKRRESELSVNKAILSHKAPPTDQAEGTLSKERVEKGSGSRTISTNPRPMKPLELDLEEARRAVEEASNNAAPSVANNPIQALNAQSMPGDEPIQLNNLPPQPAPAPMPAPSVGPVPPMPAGPAVPPTAQQQPMSPNPPINNSPFGMPPGGVGGVQQPSFQPPSPVPPPVPAPGPSMQAPMPNNNPMPPLGGPQPANFGPAPQQSGPPAPPPPPPGGAAPSITPAVSPSNLGSFNPAPPAQGPPPPAGGFPAPPQGGPGQVPPPISFDQNPPPGNMPR